jgi:hypothetical protein
MVPVVLLVFFSLCVSQQAEVSEMPPVEEEPREGYVKTVVKDVQVELVGGIISLGEADSNLTLDIYVSRTQGENIYAALHNITFPRPQTHDLFLELLAKSGMRVKFVSIDRLEEGIYYATLVIERREGSLALDARPSDSIVFALKTGTPIYVKEKLLEEQGRELEAPRRLPGFEV